MAPSRAAVLPVCRFEQRNVDFGNSTIRPERHSKSAHDLDLNRSARIALLREISGDEWIPCEGRGEAKYPQTLGD